MGRKTVDHALDLMSNISANHQKIDGRDDKKIIENGSEDVE
jgi:hypothetical protein